MGVPSLFRLIINEFPKTLSTATGKEQIDFAFMDFNCLIYHCLGKRIPVAVEKYAKGKLTDEQFEDILIAEVVNYTQYIVSKIMKPNKLLYIAIDGPPPRAKMVQQRMRRFKAIKEGKMRQQIYDEFGVKPEKSWSKSALTPATPFMKKMADALKAVAEAGDFGMNGDGTEHLRVIISDSSVAGEGEHKIIPYMRNIKANEDDVFCIYGLDADLIILAMDTYQKKIVLLREPQKTYHKVDEYDGVEFLYLDIDIFRESFIEKLDLGPYELDKIINDFTFLTFLGGNDFVTALPYLEVRNGGLDILLGIYKNLLPEMDGHLVINDGKKINTVFFKAILEKLGMIEGKMLRKLQEKHNRFKHRDDRDPEDPMERALAIMDNEPYYSEVHPQYEEYRERLERINYLKGKDDWKNAYYQEFFQLDRAGNEREFRKMRTVIGQHYMESLLWTMKYYLDGIPSWDWYYRFRAAPFISDLQGVLQNVKDVNVLGQFELGKPYRPLEQLMIVMPATSGHLLPKELRSLMTDSGSPIVEYYPVDFELDIMKGLKHIYSEPILPLIDDEHMLSVIGPIIDGLGGKDKKNNKISKKPDYFWFPKNMKKRANVKKTAAKKEATKKVTVKKESTKKEATKKEATKKVTIKKTDTKKVTVKKVDTKKANVKKTGDKKSRKADAKKSEKGIKIKVKK